MSRIVRKVFKVDGVPTDVTSAVLSDPTNSFGVKRNDTSAVIVANGTAMTRVSAGTYEYEFSDVVGVAYTAYVEIVYDGATYNFEVDFAARTSAVSGPISYSSLVERVGHYLFGADAGDSFTSEQLTKIKYCIHDGLFRVYAAHEWSFFRPEADIATTAPYSTGTVIIASGVVTLTGGTFPSWSADGILMVDSNYYSVASRDSGTQVTLDDMSVTVASSATYQLARPEVPMDAAFDAVSQDRDLTYYPSPEQWYHPVRNTHDSVIRRLESNDPTFDRPRLYSVRTSTFDPTLGSRWVIAFYPAPDDAYVLKVPMILKPVDLDDSNPYPIGGEMLSQVILESCLAAAEHNYEEREHVHEKQYIQLIALAIRKDQERSTPTSLGSDAPRDERYGFAFEDCRSLREHRIGQITLEGEIL